MMREPTRDTLGLEAELLAQLRRGMRGEVIVPEDAGYDEARAVWNGSIDRAPGVIARFASAAP
jgi:hypothetical protein